MEKHYSEIIGMEVMAQDTGNSLGRVKYVILDTDRGKIVAFVVKILSNLVVLPQDVVKWNTKIIVPSENDLISGDEVDRVKKIDQKHNYLLTKRVETENGAYLGRVYDFAIDTHFFDLKKIYVKKAFLWFFPFSRRIIGAKSIIEIKKDRVIVKSPLIKDVELSLKKELSPGV